MAFELIEHTADIGIRAYGDGLEEAFREAGRGFTSIMCDLDKIEKKGSKTLTIKGDNWDTILVDFLTELIFYFEVEDLLFIDFDIEICDNDQKELNAVCYYEEYDPNKHEISGQIKAVSYHEIAVDPKGEIRVIFDV